MKFVSRLARATLITALAATAGLALAQTAPSSVSPARKELVAKALQLQQAGIESVGNLIANQTANSVLQAAGQALGRVPADKREALVPELQAEVRKFHDEAAPMLRSLAVKLAPTTLGAALEEKFSEDELKTLVAWLESPVSRKYQQVSGEQQQALAQKVVAEARAQMEPKLKALEQSLGAKLSAAGAPAGAASGARPAAPAAKASGAATTKK